MTRMRLHKYQGLGNDFLISFDLGGGGDWGKVVGFLCERRYGIGADGFIAAGPPRHGGTVYMDLWNADGGRAETSGNGLRCLAAALADEGRARGGRVVIETVAGSRACEVGDPAPGGCRDVAVEMGQVMVNEADTPSGLDGWDAVAAETGNPHLVLMGESIEGFDMAGVGRKLEQARPGGQNVEAIAVRQGGLDLVVWERGAGLTRACGSGSVAAAAVAHSRGLVGETVPVRNPGGTLTVHLSVHDGATSATLVGPACRVAVIDLELEEESLSL